MPITYVRGQSGTVYPFNISGASPTATEQERIDQIIANAGDSVGIAPEADDGNVFTKGVSRGVDTLQLGLGSALEGLGKTTGVDFLQEYGKEVVENNKQQLAEQEADATRLDDVNDISSAASYFFSTLGEQVPQLGSTLGGAAAGAAIGSFIPIVGPAIGAVVGGVGANLPFFYGMNREAQKDVTGGIVQSEGAAALTAIPQAALDFIADRLLVGSLAKPALLAGGGIFTRGAKGLAVGAVTEVPTEIGQQVLERMQAGKDLTSQEAIDEYKEVAVAAGIIGGTVRSTTNIVSGDAAKKEHRDSQRELQEDLAELGREVQSEAALNQKFMQGITEDETVAKAVAEQGISIQNKAAAQQQKRKAANNPNRVIPINSLPKPVQDRLKVERLKSSARKPFFIAGQEQQKPNPIHTTIEELKSLGMNAEAEQVRRKRIGLDETKAEDRAVTSDKFTQEQYNSAVEAVKKSGNASVATIRAALKLKDGSKATLTQAEAIQNELIANRVVRKGSNGLFTPLTEDEIAQDPAGPLRNRLSTIKQELDNARKGRQAAKAANTKLLDGWKGTDKEEQLLRQNKENIAQYDSRIAQLEAAATDNQRQVDTIDSRTTAAGELAQQTTTAQDANLALAAANEAQKAVTNSEYQAKKAQIQKSLNDYLKNTIGLKGVKLTLPDSMSGPKENTVAEGYYDPAKKVIALALGIYSPEIIMSGNQDVLLSRMRGVMNHELIHALKDLGLFTQDEYNTLVAATEKRNFVAIKNGEKVQRKYTFFDRALALNEQLEGETDEAYKARVQEEAIAEMFRSYADGTLKVAGKPQSLFKRIVNFIFGIQQAHAQQGFDSADSIFSNILTPGKDQIAKRETGYGKIDIPQSNKKYSTAGVVAGFIPPNRGNIERIQQSFKDVTKRVPKLVEAANKLINGEISYQQYDEIVNEFKPIIPYETVPAPASFDDMVRGLNSSQVSKINQLSKIPDGTMVALRLDIPAYRDNGVWVPTIHGSKETLPFGFKRGDVISHESVSIVTDADFSMTAGQQRGALKIAADKTPKSPFATISGRLRKTTPDEAFSIAQEMMNDPEVVQVGFDPERHSYFYDRNTTAPVIGADMVVQVGPLVLAKNPKFAPGKTLEEAKSNFLYSSIPFPPNAGTLTSDTSVRTNRAYQLLPFLRVPADTKYEHKRKILAGVSPANAQSQLDALDELLANHSNTLASEDAFKDYLSDVMGTANQDGSVPLIPFNAIAMARDPSIIERQIGGLTEGQKRMAQAGFDAAKNFERAYTSGMATEEHTGKLILWGILSRGVSPYVQESLFLDVVQERGNMGGVGGFIQEAAMGRFSENDYNEWLDSVIPENSPGNGAKHNLGAFGRTTLKKLGVPDKDGVTPLAKLHRLIANNNLSGKEVRREFHKLNTGIGINNKVLSFMLLVSGRNDVMVLDRVQFRNMFNDGRFGDYNLYDGVKDDGKAVTGSGIAKTGDGTMGLVLYEALERDLMPAVQQAYNALGRGADASMGRYHWESWVAASAQEVDHGTVDGIIHDSLGIEQPYRKITTRQGKYDTYQGGSVYGYNQDGSRYVAIPDGNGNLYEFTPEKAVVVFDQIKKAANNIIPKGFKISENIERPYYERTDINKDALSALLEREGGRIVQPRVSGVSETDTDVSGLPTGPERTVKYSSVPAIEGLNTLKDFIKNNPDGFTITSQGVPVPIGTPDSGVVVAPLKSAELIVGQEIPLDTLRQYVENAKEISRILDREVFLGGWFNADDNQYYLDNTLVVKDKAEALYIAEAAEQIAVYDLTVPPYGQEINTNDGIRQLKEAGIYRDNIAERYRGSIEQAGKLFAESRLQDQGQEQRERRERQDAIASIDDFLALEDAHTEVMSEAEEAQIKPIHDIIATSKEASDKNYSSVPTDPYRPIVNPVAKRKFEKTGETFKFPYLFGSIRTGDRLEGVYLFDGQHNADNPEDPSNFGLYHITQRKHDKELSAVSKYDSVEQAIYDTMQAWARQDYQDGTDVISTPSPGGTVVLDWKQPTHGSKSPFRLVLERRRGRGGQAFFRVKTFFPVLTAKQSKALEGKFSSIPVGVAYSTAVPAPSRAATANNVATNLRGMQYSRAYDVLARALGMVPLVDKDKARVYAMKALTNFQDRFLPIGVLIDNLRELGVTIPDAMDTYLQETLFHGTTGDRINTAARTMWEPVAQKVKALDLSDGTNFERLKSASDFVKLAVDQTGSRKMAVVDAYLYALHAKERNQYIRSINENENYGSGMGDAEADAIIDWVESQSNDQRQRLYEIRDDVAAIVADTNKTRRDAGLIPESFEGGVFTSDEDTEGHPAPDYQYYVPLRGILDPDGDVSEEGSFRKGGGGFAVRGREDRKALGRGYGNYGHSILSGVFMQNQDSIIRAEKNKVGQSFLDLIRANSDQMSRIATILDTAPMRRGLVNGSVRNIVDLAAMNDPSIFVVKEGGEHVYVKIYDQRIAQALRGMNGVSTAASSAIVRTMGKFNRFLSNINTSFNPEFLVTNMIRDIQTAGVNINQFERAGLAKEVMGNFKSAFKGVKDIVRGGAESTITKEQAEAAGFDINSISNADLFRLFQMYGGQNATNQMSDLADQVQNVKKIVGDIADSGMRGNLNKMKQSFVGQKGASMLKLLEDYNTVVENAIRVATFKTLAPKIGYQRAAFAARNVTVDFAKGGEYKTLMNSMYLFYNASLQGSFALLNAAAKSSKVRKIWAGIIVAGILQDQLNAALSDEDEDGNLVYDKIPQYILEHNLILPDPFGMTDRSVIAIPMPYGLNMAANFGRAMSRAARGEYSPAEVTGTVFGTAADTLNPIGGTESFINFLSPTVFDPIVDMYENEDFAGKAIYKEASPFDPTPPPNSQLYWSTTSPIAKSIAKEINSLTGGDDIQSGLIDMNPDIMEYWFEFFTGGAGRFVQRSGDLAFGTMPTILTDGFEDEMVRQIPFARKVFYSVSSREDLGNFIEGRDRVLKSEEMWKAALKSGNPAAVRSIRENRMEDLRVLGQIKAINNARNKLMRRIRQIESSNMPESTKENAIKRMREQIDVLILRGNKVLASAA